MAMSDPEAQDNPQGGRETETDREGGAGTKDGGSSHLPVLVQLMEALGVWRVLPKRIR